MKTLLLAGLLALAGAGPASAYVGINLFWDDCALGGGRSINDDACEATRSLVVSVETGQTIANIAGAQGYVDVSFDAGDIPDYWRVDAGGCRAGKLVADGQVGSGSPPFSCLEPWSQVGGQVTGVQFAPYTLCNNRARITWLLAVRGGTVTLDVNVAGEWYIMKLVFAGGATNCAGCSVGACFVANEVRLVRPAGAPEGDVFINGPASSQHATWRNPYFACPGTDGGGPSCPTPVLDSTWGQIKSMYR